MSTFTPNPRLNANTNPRDWAYELGLSPQTTSIVFTKSSLIAFLKTHGIEVGPNNTEINKLPKFASIGKMEDAVPEIKEAEATPAPFTEPRAAPAVVSLPAAEPTTASKAAPEPETVSKVEPTTSSDAAIPAVQEVKTPDGETFRPTRRVREPIGGGSAQIGALFGGGDDYNDTMKEAEREQARRRGLAVEQPAAKPVQAPLRSIENHQQQEAQTAPKESAAFRPTRRVREPGGTGGQSSISLG